MPYLVLLEVADEMPVEVGREQRNLGACFLYLAFPEDSLASVQGQTNFVGIVPFGYSHERNIFGPAIRSVSRGGYPCFYLL